MKKTPRGTQQTPKKRGAAATPPSVNSSELMSLAEIKELIELVADKQFTAFELERGNFRLRLRRGGVVGAAAEAVPQVAPPVIASSAPAVRPEIRPVEMAATVSAATAPAPAEEPLHFVASPIVGTFYRSPSPTADPFVKLGDTIQDGQTLCIIEAMKLMNEIPSDVSGMVVQIFPENGQPVEYGQPLFGIKV